MNYHCKGCIEKNACPIQDGHVEEYCPCSICLVKVTCETGCINYDLFYEKYSLLQQELLSRKD